MSSERLTALAGVQNKSTCAITHDAAVGAWQQDMIKGSVFQLLPVIKCFHLALGIAFGFITLNDNQQASQTWSCIYRSLSKQNYMASINTGRHAC